MQHGTVSLFGYGVVALSCQSSAECLLFPAETRSREVIGNPPACTTVLSSTGRDRDASSSQRLERRSLGRTKTHAAVAESSCTMSGPIGEVTHRQVAEDSRLQRAARVRANSQRPHM